MVRFTTKILCKWVSILSGTTILISVILLPMHHITAQTLERILKERNVFKMSPQIKLDGNLEGMVIDEDLNKVYVINQAADAVSIIDSNSGNVTNNIRVGETPSAIALDVTSHKAYVANSGDNTVSVINGLTDSKEPNDIRVGKNPDAIAIDSLSHKVYVANSPSLLQSGTVSVINTTTESKKPNDIPVGMDPTAIAIDELGCCLYVANWMNDSVSVIDTTTESKKPDIPVGMDPMAIADGFSTAFPFSVYVANWGNNSVSVLDRNDMTSRSIPVGANPSAMAIDSDGGKVYVANSGSGTVSVIDTTTYSKEPNDIRVGKNPKAITIDLNSHKVYVANSDSGTVSVIDTTTESKKPNDIPVGAGPSAIEFDHATGLLYVMNSQTVSVIKGSDDKVAAGITFNVSPGNSGNIVCNTYSNPNVYNNTYPTNTYLYVESGTNCYAKPNKDFKFSSWVQNLGHNSTITLNTTAISDSPWNSILRLIGRGPNDPSTAFEVNGYGSFTANFKPLPPPVPPEYWASLFTVVATALVGSLLIPAGVGLLKSKRQTSRLNSYHREINLYGKGNTERLSTTYNKLVNAYSEGKISNEQYTNLKTEISILYEEIYKKRIDSSNGNLKLLDEIKDEIQDAYAKEQLNEQHYNLLIEKISDGTNDR